MKLSIAQLNPLVGGLAQNTQTIIEVALTAHAAGAHLLLTPELSLTGYPPEDLLLRPSFIEDCQTALGEIAEAVPDIAVIVGVPRRVGGVLYNAAVVLHQGRIVAEYHKMNLPNEAVFDECRYFTPGAQPVSFQLEGITFGVLICEDVWQVEPATAAVEEAGAEVLLVLNASPFHVGKQIERENQVRWRIEETSVPIVYANLVGGQDELVFDGASFACTAEGEKCLQLPAFEVAHAVLEFSADKIPHASALSPLPPSEEAWVYGALVLGVRDYIGKNRFPGALLGLSGGVDSALTLAVAVDALGAEKVHAVMMPSRYTASISIEDSRKMVEGLGVPYDELDIEPTFNSFLTTLSPLFEGLAVDTTEENLQARVRGTLLMALSNKTGKLVLTTGNKSEMTAGYATLYGDMAGGFAVLKDVAKTLVYRVCEWRNAQQAQEIIPSRIITRPPSAELRDNQTDQDSLPPYEVLDAIMSAYVEENLSPAQIIGRGFKEADVNRIIRLLKISEYKRRQAAIGVRITPRGFGKDWRYPITNGYLS